MSEFHAPRLARMPQTTILTYLRWHSGHASIP